MTVGSRSIRMMAILFVFNSILAAVALFNMYSVAERQDDGGDPVFAVSGSLHVRLLDRIYHAAFHHAGADCQQYQRRAGTPDAGTDADDHDGAA